MNRTIQMSSDTTELRITKSALDRKLGRHFLILLVRKEGPTTVFYINTYPYLGSCTEVVIGTWCAGRGVYCNNAVETYGR